MKDATILEHARLQYALVRTRHGKQKRSSLCALPLIKACSNAFCMAIKRGGTIHGLDSDARNIYVHCTCSATRIQHQKEIKSKLIVRYVPYDSDFSIKLHCVRRLICGISAIDSTETNMRTQHTRRFVIVRPKYHATASNSYFLAGAPPSRPSRQCGYKNDRSKFGLRLLDAAYV